MSKILVKLITAKKDSLMRVPLEQAKVMKLEMKMSMTLPRKLKRL